MTDDSIFTQAGGVEAFHRLVDAFYDRVEDDELLRPQYPEDLTHGKVALGEFLAQYFGGGDIYSATRGHPRLRMRHAPFTITPEVASHWAAHMVDAIEAQDFAEPVEMALLEYVVRATPTMINELPTHVSDIFEGLTEGEPDPDAPS